MKSIHLTYHLQPFVAGMLVIGGLGKLAHSLWKRLFVL